MNNNIMEQLDVQMSKCEEEFKLVNEKVVELTKQLEELSARREQIRGQYTAYYNMKASLEKENTDKEPVKPETKTLGSSIKNNEPEPKKEEKKKVPEKSETVVEETAKKEVVAQNEQRVDNILNVVQQEAKKDDVPDYLK